MPRGDIPIERVQPYLEEIVRRAGSQRKAAQELGVSRTQLRLWLRSHRRIRSGKTYNYVQRVTQESAALILSTLLKLRREGVFYDHRGKAGPKPRWLRSDDREAEYRRHRRASA